MTFDFYLFTKIGGIALFIFVGGAAAARQLALKRTRTYTINAVAVFMAFLGSRTWYFLQNEIPDVQSQGWAHAFEIWNDSGAVLYGWIFGGMLTLYVFSRLFKFSLIRYLDAVLPWLLVTQFMNRLGCFDAGCCYGKLTDFPISCRNWVLNGQVHPVQLYEGLFDLALFAFIKTRPKQIGRPTFLYFTCYPIARFFFEFLRGDNGPALWFMTVPQVTSVLILITVFLLRKKLLIKYAK